MCQSIIDVITNYRCKLVSPLARSEQCGPYGPSERGSLSKYSCGYEQVKLEFADPEGSIVSAFQPPQWLSDQLRSSDIKHNGYHAFVRFDQKQVLYPNADVSHTISGGRKTTLRVDTDSELFDALVEIGLIQPYQESKLYQAFMKEDRKRRSMRLVQNLVLSS